MGNPFQDQLLKAGLVNKKQVKKAKHDQRVNKKKNKGKTGQNNEQAQKQRAAAQRIQELNKQQNLKKQELENLAQVKQLISQNRLQQDDKGEAYNFVEENKIKRIFVDEKMAEQLSVGQLAIVKDKNKYEVVSAKVARQIANRDQSRIISHHDPKSGN